MNPKWHSMVGPIPNEVRRLSVPQSHTLMTAITVLSCVARGVETSQPHLRASLVRSSSSLQQVARTHDCERARSIEGVPPSPSHHAVLMTVLVGNVLLQSSRESPSSSSPMCTDPLPQYFGKSGLKKNYALQIRNIVNAGYRSIGERPVLIGETGIPFDLNGSEAFKTGDFKWQERQMDAVCSAMEENLVSFK